MKKMLGWLGAGALVAGGGIAVVFLAIIAGLALSVGLACVGAIIPWLLWNHVFSPMFSWPLATYWQAVAVVWVIGFVANLFRSRKS